MGGIEPAALASLLGRRGRFQGRVVVFSDVDSTQDEAARWVRSGNDVPALVLAGAQRAGRGRTGRSWYSPVGGVYATLCLRPSTNASRWPSMTVAAGLALAQVLDEAGVAGVDLKWPNDCRVFGRKVAGILSEALPEAGVVLVGVGINGVLDPRQTPDDLAGSAVGLASVLPSDLALDVVCAQALERIAQACVAVGAGESIEPGRVDRFLAIGREVAVAGRRGRVGGVTASGALVLAIGSENVEIDVGEVCDAGGD